MSCFRFVTRCLLLPWALLHGASALPQDEASPSHPVADLVLRGGRIVTLDEARPEVRALAVVDHRIRALGSLEEIDPWIGEGTSVIELAGRLAIPGFIEGHGHFLGVGDAHLQLDLAHAASWEEIVAMVSAAAREARPGELIRGRGWHQEKWSHPPEPAVEGLPLHASLSQASPNNPVLLVHASGHALFANQRAMQLAGIDRLTPDPGGGEIVRTPEGDPIGVFRERAMDLLAPVRERAVAPNPRRQIELAQAECLAKGITSFQDAGSSLATIALLREMAEEGQLLLRLWVMVREPLSRLEEGLEGVRCVGLGEEHLSVRAIKQSLDGALGSHGAWLLEPYSDLPTSTGLATLPLEELERTAELALEHDMQLCVHAIGDRANREVLDLFERVWRKAGVLGADLRWRIEHAQHLAPEEIPRFGALGVIASMQAVHCTSDGSWVPERIGDQRAASGAYMWRALLDSGAVVTNGTDAPVEDVDPIATFAAMVSRRLPDGTLFYPGQRLGRLEALRAATLSAAYAAFEEDEKGSLSPGKLADIVVLDQDILDCPEDRIRETRVRMTIVGGEVLYEAGD